MRTSKHILEEISQIADRKLTRTDIRKSRSLIAKLPADKVGRLMCMINETPKYIQKKSPNCFFTL